MEHKQKQRNKQLKVIFTTNKLNQRYQQQASSFPYGSSPSSSYYSEIYYVSWLYYISSYLFPLRQQPTYTTLFLSLNAPKPSLLFFANSPQQTQLFGYHQSPSPCFTPSSKNSVCHPPKQRLPSKCQIRQMLRAMSIVQFVYLFITKFSQGILSSVKMFLAVSYSSDFYWFLQIRFSVKSLGILTVSLNYSCFDVCAQRSLRYDSEERQETKYSGNLWLFGVLVVFVGFLGLTAFFYSAQESEERQLLFSACSSLRQLCPRFLLVIMLMSSFNFYMAEDGSNRGKAGPNDASNPFPSSFLRENRKLLIFPKLPAVDCCCLFLKLSQISLAEAALKL